MSNKKKKARSEYIKKLAKQKEKEEKQKSFIIKMYEKVKELLKWDNILMFSLYGYFNLYLYNRAFFTYFHININFLQLNPIIEFSNLAMITINTLAICAIVKITIYLNKSIEPQKISTYFTSFLIDVALSTAIIYLTMGINICTMDMLSFIIIGILIAIIEIIIIYIIISVIKFIKNKLKITTNQIKNKRDSIIDVLYIICSISFLFTQVGYTAAETKKDFYIIEETNQIVLYSTADYAIVSTYNNSDDNETIEINSNKHKKIALENVELTLKTFNEIIIN